MLKKKIKTTILILMSMIFALLLFECIYPRFAHRMDYQIESKYYHAVYSNIDYGYTKQEIRSKLEDIVGVDHYLYFEKSLGEQTAGCTLLMFRTILIASDLSVNEYIEIVCHEFIHLKYNTGNERFTQYQTFITLYNSEFRQIALNIAHDMQAGRYAYEYDCTAQIVDFLNNKVVQ